MAAGYLRASPPPGTAERKGCTLGALGPTPVSRDIEGGGRYGVGRGAGTAGGMWEMRGARLAPGPRLGQPGLSGPGISLTDTTHTHTHPSPPVPLPSCCLISGPPRPFAFPRFAPKNEVDWYVRARALGLVLTRTPELRRGASLEPEELEDWVRSQQGTSSHFCLSPSNLVAGKSRGS